MSWMPFLLQGAMSSIRTRNQQIFDSSSNNKHMEKRNEIEEKKLRQQEIANRINALSSYSDNELLEKLDSLERTITCDTTFTVRGGDGNKVIYEDSLGKRIEDNPDYIRIEEELKSRGVSL